MSSTGEWISVNIIPIVSFARLKWKYSDGSVDYGVWMKGEFCTMDACRELQITHYQILSDEYLTLDEYARQTAIGFAEWVSGEGYQQYDGADRWIAPHNSTRVYSTPQLFALYLIHLQSLDK